MRRFAAFFVLAATAALAAGAEKAHPHDYNLLDVHWKVILHPSTGSFDGDVINTVRMTVAGGKIQFDCGPLSIAKVTVDGKSVPWTLADSKLTPEPKRKLKMGERVSVEIVYSGSPTAGMYFVSAKNAFPAHTPMVYTQGEMEDNHFWLPTYDYPDDKASSDAEIDVPKGWKAISNGALAGVQHLGKRDLWHWKMTQKHSTYLNSFVAGPYDIVPDPTSLTTPVSIWVPSGLDAMGTATFGGTGAILDFYGKLTGVPFPWPKYAQATVADFMFGGMENVTCTTQTIDVLHPMSAEPVDDSTELAAHELAHQWFGDYVTLKSWAHTWLNEGWATFMPNFWDRQKFGKDRFDLDRYNIFQGGLAAHAMQSRPVVWTDYRRPIDMFNGFAYPGGAARLFMLMHQVGEPRFWSAIHDYLVHFAYKNADTPGFFKVVGKSLGMNLGPFMKQWFYTPAAPWINVTRQDGSIVLVQQGTVFDLPLDVWLIDAEGNVQKSKIECDAAQTIIPDSQGKSVLIDPRVWVMTNLTYELGYTDSDWMKLYYLAPNAAEKARIVDEAAGSLTSADLDLLALTETSPDVQNLLTLRLTDAATLHKLAASTNEIERSDVFRTMAKVANPTPAMLDDLRTAVADETNPAVKMNAFQTLLTLTNDSSLADEAWHKNAFNDGYRVMALNWWATHDENRARAEALSALSGNSSEPVQLTAIRVLGEVKDAQGEHAAYDALVSVLHEKTIGPLQAAMRALANYGNKNAIPLIEAYRTHSLYFVRDTVNACVQELESSGD